MIDYAKLNRTLGLRKPDSIAGRERTYNLAVHQDIRNEERPYAPRMFVSKGTILATLGGLTEFRDATGGTVIFTYNPDTGVITLNGGVIFSQTLNIGSINNTAIMGTSRNIGTFDLGVGTLGTLWNTNIINGTAGTLVVTGGRIAGGIPFVSGFQP